MKRLPLLLILPLALVGCGAGSATTSTHASAPPVARVTAPATATCHMVGTGLTARPDRHASCTPGQWIDTMPPLATVCAVGYNPRPPAPVFAALKRKALAEYGLPTSATGYEADHLYPVWLGGASTLANIWPEKDYTHAKPFQLNPKDDLEFVIYKMVCQSHKLSIAQGRAIFTLSWTTAYKRYVSPTPITDR